MFYPLSRLALVLLASTLVAGCQVDTASSESLEKLRATLQSSEGHSSSRDCDDDDRDHDRDHDDDHDDDDHDCAPSPVVTHPIPLPSSSPAPGASCYIERFQQPTSAPSRAVDILFVADTSGSMRDNRRKVADGIFSLIEHLPQDADYRVGVMLAHGSRSPDSGLLWRLPQSQGSVPGNPYVLDSQQLNANNLRGRLRALMEAARDQQQEPGEMGLYSFMQSLTSEKFSQNQARGFYRSEAALAVVFISDENDICAVYPSSAHGTPGLTPEESQIRARDCAQGISAQSVIEAARQVKGSNAVVFGAITHTEQEEHDDDDHEGFGWGYSQLIELSQGISIDIDDCHYEEGLERIGDLVSQRLELITSRRLEHSPVEISSISIWVDNVGQTGTFVPSTNTVHLNYAGVAGSWVEISYCLEGSTGGGSTGGGSTGGGSTGGGSTGGGSTGGGSTGGGSTGGGSTGGVDPGIGV